MLWVSEYRSIVRGQTNKILKDGDLELCAEDFESVLSFVEPSNTNELNTVFRYFRNEGVDCLRVQNFVGVIRTKSECQFEILPKISRTMDVQSSQDLLIKMLVELGGAPFKQGLEANLRGQKMSLLERFLWYFLQQVTNIIRQGIARSYTDKQDNVVFLRGKLQLTEHLKKNLVRHNVFYCEFDEFDANRPINRLIKSALEVVLRQSRDPGNIQQCRELLFWFDRVPSSTNVSQDFRSLRQDRFVQHYSRAMPSCRLILEELNPLTRGGEHITISLLFDMNTVFQEYVVAKLSQQLSNWQIQSQVRGYHLVESFKQTPCFGLIPDIELRHNGFGLRVIADCKWKVIESEKPELDISPADMYQLFAYCKKCLVDQDIRYVFLIYPKTDQFREPLEPFYFDKDTKDTLYALPFDIEQDCLMFDVDNTLNKNMSELVA